MTNEQTTSLRTLRDDRLEFVDPSADVRGRTVLDKSGLEIGTVEAVLVDDAQRKVRFLRVAKREALGFGKEKFLIPVDAIAAVDEKVVRVDRSREHVASAPAYDPKLMENLDRILDHYGAKPYWEPGYRYPTYP